ncbi:cell division protein FtsL [Rheinheimera sp.]|uniref:cell division protein FtsL n=1 Tax=Rheinheimera sp. TaxID=1869214 RepID=UPI00307EE2E1
MSAIKLNRLILVDIWRHKLVITLILACLGSALAVVEFTHMNRQLTMTEDKLLQQRDSLEMEWRNLLVEQRALAEHSRVEDIAANQLNMVRPYGAQEVVVQQ